MKRILTYGTFDLIHPGHINLLRQAKAMGTYLIVGLSTDDFNQLKGKKAYHSYENRKLILEAIRFVDEVIPEFSWEQKIKDIETYNIDLFVMGDDWKNEFDDLRNHTEVIYLPRTLGISTSKIKEDFTRLQNG